MINPTIGHIVHYCLTEDDCSVIRGQRRLTSSGRSGNGTNPGDIVAMIIAAIWEGDNLTINGQCILDGNDSLWITSAHEGIGRGQWHWPPRT